MALELLCLPFGRAHVINSGLGQVPKYHIPKNDVPDELQRFRKAVSKAQKQVKRLKAKTSLLTDASAEELELLLDAHAECSFQPACCLVSRKISSSLI